MKRTVVCEVLIALCALVNAYLFAGRCWRTFVALRHASNLQSISNANYTYVGDDYPEYVPLAQPARSAVRKTFSLAPDAFPISGPGAAEAWQAIYPRGYGFVRMGEHARLLCVALFHQLHCVEKMRLYLDDPVGNAAHVGFAHQQHCMNYLRQLFLCRADRTLEPLDLGDGSALPFDVGADGFADLDPALDLAMRSGRGVTHTCGDAEALYSFVGDNYARWKASWNISSPFDTGKDGEDAEHHDH